MSKQNRTECIFVQKCKNAKSKYRSLFILTQVKYSIIILMRCSKKTIVPTEVESGAIIKSAASH